MQFSLSPLLGSADAWLCVTRTKWYCHRHIDSLNYLKHTFDNFRFTNEIAFNCMIKSARRQRWAQIQHHWNEMVWRWKSFRRRVLLERWIALNSIIFCVEFETNFRHKIRNWRAIVASTKSPLLFTKSCQHALTPCSKYRRKQFNYRTTRALSNQFNLFSKRSAAWLRSAVWIHNVRLKWIRNRKWCMEQYAELDPVT